MDIGNSGNILWCAEMGVREYVVYSSYGQSRSVMGLTKEDTNSSQTLSVLTQSSACVKQHFLCLDAVGISSQWSWDLRALPRHWKSTLAFRTFWRVPSLFANKCELRKYYTYSLRVTKKDTEHHKKMRTKMCCAITMFFYRPKLNFCK